MGEQRVWRYAPVPPPSVKKVRDRSGVVWERRPDAMWESEWSRKATPPYANWDDVLRTQGPLTEVPASPCLAETIDLVGKAVTCQLEAGHEDDHRSGSKFWGDSPDSLRAERDAARAEAKTLLADLERAGVRRNLVELERDTARAKVRRLTDKRDAQFDQVEQELARTIEERDQARAEIERRKAAAKDLGGQYRIAAEGRLRAAGQSARLRVAAGHVLEVLRDRADGRQISVGDAHICIARLRNALDEAGEESRDPLAEVDCPQCGATIRAKMADSPPTAEQWERAAEAAYDVRFDGQPVNPWEFLGEFRKEVWRSEVRAAARELGVPGAEEAGQ